MNRNRLVHLCGALVLSLIPAGCDAPAGDAGAASSDAGGTRRDAGGEGGGGEGGEPGDVAGEQGEGGGEQGEGDETGGTEATGGSAVGGEGGAAGGVEETPDAGPGGQPGPACDTPVTRQPLVRFDSGPGGARIVDELFPGHETTFLRRTADEATVFVSAHRPGLQAPIFQSESGTPGRSETLLLSADDIFASMLDPRGDVTVLDVARGEELWSENVARLTPAFLPEVYRVFARPSGVYVAADDGGGDGEVTRVDFFSGRRLWSTRGTAELLLDEADGVLLTANYDVVEGRDLQTGQSLYHSPMPSPTVGGLGFHAGAAIVLLLDSLVGIDPHTGRLLWSVPVEVARRSYRFNDTSTLWTWEVDLENRTRVMGIDLASGRVLTRAEGAYLVQTTRNGWAVLVESDVGAWVLAPDGREVFRVDSTEPGLRVGETGPIYVSGAFEGMTGLQARDRETGSLLWNLPDPDACSLPLGVDVGGRALCVRNTGDADAAAVEVRSAVDGRLLVNLDLFAEPGLVGQPLSVSLTTTLADGWQHLRLSLMNGDRIIRDLLMDLDTSAECP